MLVDLLRQDRNPGIRDSTKRGAAQTFAWVEVVTDPETVARCEEDGLEEVGIDAPEMPSGLDSLRAERNAQRGYVGFGAFAGRDVVYLRRPWVRFPRSAGVAD